VWGADHNQSEGSGAGTGDTVCSTPSACPGADIGIAIDSAGPTFLYGTNSEHHAITSYELRGAQNVTVVMAQNEYRGYGPDTPDAPMCTSTAMEIHNSKHVHVYGLTACNWHCKSLKGPQVHVSNSSDVAFVSLYELGVVYGIEAHGRPPLQCHNTVAAQWATVPA
jgi:hypothetical protein